MCGRSTHTLYIGVVTYHPPIYSYILFNIIIINNIGTYYTKPSVILKKNLLV